MLNSKLLLDLCAIDSISGREGNINEYLKEKLKQYSNNVYVTKLNSVICEVKKPKEGAPKIVLEAHTDTVGLVASSITGDGYIKALRCGGLDFKSLIYKKVTVCSNPKLSGFIFKNGQDSDNIFIDVSLKPELVKKYVKEGDSIVFDYNPLALQNNRICVRYLDNRASVFVVLLVLEKLKEKNLDVGIYAMFSSLEETSQGGAVTSSYELMPDVAICVDVSFAKTPGCDNLMSLGIMGRGPMVGISPVLNKDLANKFIDVAKINNIPYQLEIMNGLTGTNADSITTTKNGIPCALLSIPLKNMHTPFEIVDLNDIHNTVDLIYNTILNF